MNETMTLKYWTGLMRCGCGGEVGGEVTLDVTPDEKAYLLSCKGLDEKEFTQKLKEENLALWERIHSSSVEALEIQMAEDVFGDFDFSDKKFEGWSHAQKIDYIRKDADPNVSIDDLCELTYEVPE